MRFDIFILLFLALTLPVIGFRLRFHVSRDSSLRRGCHQIEFGSRSRLCHDCVIKRKNRIKNRSWNMEADSITAAIVLKFTSLFARVYRVYRAINHLTAISTQFFLSSSKIKRSFEQKENDLRSFSGLCFWELPQNFDRVFERQKNLFRNHDHDRQEYKKIVLVL